MAFCIAYLKSTFHNIATIFSSSSAAGDKDSPNSNLYTYLCPSQQRLFSTDPAQSVPCYSLSLPP